MTRATLAKHPDQVSTMFDEVAPRYDIVNDVLCLGQNWYWRSRVRRAVDVRPGQHILDLAAGTCTSTRSFAGKGASVTACDRSRGMLAVGQRRMADWPGMTFTTGDALALPFADDSFDTVTISFGLRNVADTPLALRELRRVVAPGGRLVICEFSTPPARLVRAAFHRLLVAIPAFTRLFTTNPAAYAYLGESIRAWHDQSSLTALVTEAGWADVEWTNLSAGAVAVHTALNPVA